MGKIQDLYVGLGIAGAIGLVLLANRKKTTTAATVTASTTSKTTTVEVTPVTTNKPTIPTNWTAAQYTEDAWANGFKLSYSCQNYNSLPTWLSTYINLISS